MLVLVCTGRLALINWSRTPCSAPPAPPLPGATGARHGVAGAGPGLGDTQTLRELWEPWEVSVARPGQSPAWLASPAKYLRGYLRGGGSEGLASLIMQIIIPTSFSSKIFFSC